MCRKNKTQKSMTMNDVRGVAVWTGMSRCVLFIRDRSSDLEAESSVMEGSSRALRR